MKRVETATTRYELLDNGIVTALEINPELERSKELVAEALDALEELLDGRRFPGLWDPRPLIKVFPPGWRQLLDRLDDLVTALAVVVDEDTPGVKGLYPTLMQSQYVPVRLFFDEDEAMQWLAGHTDAPDGAM